MTKNLKLTKKKSEASSDASLAKIILPRQTINQ
jgi:hypothetical protein